MRQRPRITGTIIFLLVGSIFFFFRTGFAFEDNSDHSRFDRMHLEEKGVSFEINYTGDVVGIVSGGLENGVVYVGNLDLTMTVDTQKFGLWDNGTFFVYGIDSHGTNLPTEKFIGDLQYADNIESPRIFRLYELWYEQKFADDKFSLLAGLHDANSDFFLTDNGGLFINSSFGVGADILDNTILSILPLTTPGVRFKWMPCEYFDVMAGVFAGDPKDDQANQHGLYWSWNKKTGQMTVVEAALHQDIPILFSEDKLPGTFKFGSWHHSKDVEDVFATDDLGDPVKHDDNYGFYSIWDQQLYCESEEQGLGFFIQYGQAPDDRNTVDVYLGAGLNYTGPIPGRDHDQIGMAYNQASITDDLRLTDNIKDKYEQVVELSYRSVVTDSIVLQPDVQFIKNPNADPTIENAVVVMLRTEISF